MKQKVPFLPSSDEAAKHNKAKGPGRHLKFGQSLSFSSQRRDRGYDDGRALSSSHPPDSDTAEEEKLKADIHNFRRERVIDLKFSCCMTRLTH